MKTVNWWAGKTAPLAYSYSPDTGEYLGSLRCDPSPLEPGQWLVPGSATLKAPPEYGEKQVPVWAEGKWKLRPDHRGELRYLDGDFVTITSIGDPKKDLGLPPMIVHGARYVLPEGARDPDSAMIRMRINKEEIEFHDNPKLIPRQLLAAWEAQGGVIEPVSYDAKDYEPEPEELPSMTRQESEAARRKEILDMLNGLSVQER